MRRVVSTAVAVLLAVVLSGCSGFLEGTDDDAGFIVGESSVVQYEPDERSEPLSVSFPSLAGEEIDVTDYRGEVVVLNFWGSWCGPCHAEAPTLVEADAQLDAVFLGAQLRPQDPEADLAFERKYGIEFPTLEDGGQTITAMGSFGPRQPPSTAILDPEGRVAALISGPVDSVTTLEGLVEDARA